MLPTGSTLEQTEEVMTEVRTYFLEEEKEAVDSVMILCGRSFAGASQNMGMGFVRPKDWDLRQRPDLKVDALSSRAMRRFAQIRNARVFGFAPPAIPELGSSPCSA
ncbi:MAG: efflux RND transporter permease subunit [Deltaproteobacteria bacterium]|nr:efflux RND transporter permease subunit [Deltaproteobacteria bacterium]